jgi:hypothetical protein
MLNGRPALQRHGFMFGFKHQGFVATRKFKVGTSSLGVFGLSSQCVFLNCAPQLVAEDDMPSAAE